MGATWGQQGVWIAELALALVLATCIGVEREARGKSAGIRTQAIVGTTAALLMQVSKYGFMDVLVIDHVALDPSRVAAQIVSGIGFLGAGIILTRSGAVHGLTTAATVWETAAIGMAAGAGLWLLAVVVTAFHFLIVFALAPLGRRFERRRPRDQIAVSVSYVGGQGVLRQALDRVTAAGWSVSRVVSGDDDTEEEAVVGLHLRRRGGGEAGAVVAVIETIPGVREVRAIDAEDVE